MLNMLSKQKELTKDDNGKFTSDALPKHFRKDYSQAVVDYLNCLNPLFEKAQKKDEFQFILTLLRFRGIKSSEEDPYDNSIRTFDAVAKMQRKMDGLERTNILLWLYGHIIEASEPYETTANLLNILEGKGYSPSNFPKKKRGKDYFNQYPLEKIRSLEERAKKLGMVEVMFPIKDVYDRDLRNAVFHADYAVDFGDVVLADPPKIYSHEKIANIINRTFAYHEIFKNLINNYIRDYDKSKIIPTTLGFSPDPKEKAILIVRKKHGVIGIKNAWSNDELKRGKSNWMVVNMHRYEKKYIDKGIVELPPSRVDLAKSLLSIFPKNLRNRLIPVSERLLEKYA